MGIFDNIQNVKASLDANYIRPGHYAFLIESGKLSKDRKGIPFVVLEMICVKSFNDSEAYLPLSDGDAPEVKCHFEGERASHLIKNGGAGVDMFLPNIKAMITGVMGIPESEVTPDIVTKIFVDKDKDSEWKGLVVEVEARNRKTQAGKDFTRISYKRAIPPTEFESIGVVLPKEWQELMQSD